jgi:hypothetical protein
MQADLPICRTCGVQYPAPRVDCPICLDQRQYAGWDGQQWTTLAELRGAGHRGETRPEGPGVVGVGAQPSTAIGQRALLVRAPSGNVLWDMITYIDDDMIPGRGCPEFAEYYRLAEDNPAVSRVIFRKKVNFRVLAGPGGAGGAHGAIVT